jgi:hypothetical protein
VDGIVEAIARLPPFCIDALALSGMILRLASTSIERYDA